ncbi:MAG: hypothetical protein OXC08_20770 [Thiotrichales bacterium]|nr:hypothetical protein [Thiotrichales bacterium]
MTASKKIPKGARSYGARAYHLRKITGKSWVDIAVMLRYRPKAADTRKKLGRAMLHRAKRYAEVRVLAWPPKAGQ